MTQTLLIELAVKSTIVAGAALALLAVLNRRSAAERSWIAHAALAVLAALPAAVILLPRWRLLPPAESMPALPTTAAAPVGNPAAVDPSLWLQGVYAAGVAMLLLATVVAVLRLVALRRGAAVLVDPDWLSALARAKARMKVRSGAALLVSTALTSPVSWGLVRPTIVVNQGLVASKDDAEAVIAHELAHVVRRDWAKLIGARVVTALFWFNPLVWALARQCHQLREEAADDAVLAADVSSTGYASLLVEAARHQGRSLAAHGVAPGKGSLHRRVTRVLDVAARRTPTPAAWATGVAAGAVFFAGPLAALTLERAEAAPVAEVTVSVTGIPATAAEPAATTVEAAPAPVTVNRHRLTLAQAGPAAATETGRASRKANLTLAAPRVEVTTTAKVRVAEPPAEADSARAVKVVTTASPDVTVTVGRKGGGSVTASSSVSQTLTANGNTIRIETDRRGDAADRADRRADERDRLADEKDRRADEQERRRDEAERVRDQEERNAARAKAHDAADRARTAKAVQRDRANLEADAARVAATARRDKANLAAEAARVADREAAAIGLTQRKAPLPPAPY